MTVTTAIPWLDDLPELCHECPFCDNDMRCMATKDRKDVNGWRPFWCPLHIYQWIPAAIIRNKRVVKLNV